MKAKLAFALALLLSVSLLGGCAPGDNSANDPSQATASTAAAEPAISDSDEEVTLVFWDMAWAGESYYNKMLEVLDQLSEENPGIKIDYQSIPWDGYVQNFTTAIVSGAGPDFGTGGSSMQHLFAEMDEILYLDSIVDEWKQSGVVDDFLPGTLETIRYNGHQVGIPWNYDPMMMWYNAEHFEEAGIAKTPENMDELHDTLVKLRDAGKGGLVTDGTFHYKTLSLWHMFAWNYGDGGLIRDGEIIVDNDASKQAFTFFRTMVQEDLMPIEVAGWNDPDAIKWFLQGNASIVFNNQNVQRIAEESAPEMLDKLKIMTPFATGTANPTNQIMGFKQTQYPEQTKRAIAWLSSNEKALFTESELTQVPVRISIGQEDAVLDRGNMRFIIQDVLPRGKGNGYPSDELYPQFQTIMNDGVITNAVQRMMLTDDPVEDIAAEAREALEKIMNT